MRAGGSVVVDGGEVVVSESPALPANGVTVPGSGENNSARSVSLVRWSLFPTLAIENTHKTTTFSWHRGWSVSLQSGSSFALTKPVFHSLTCFPVVAPSCAHSYTSTSSSWIPRASVASYYRKGIGPCGGACCYWKYSPTD